MKQVAFVILGSLFCLLLLYREEARAAVLPDDSVNSLDGYESDDLRDAIRVVLAGEADKRGFRCRPGYTYQSILRDCVPSLGNKKIYPCKSQFTSIEWGLPGCSVQGFVNVTEKKSITY